MPLRETLLKRRAHLRFRPIMQAGLAPLLPGANLRLSCRAGKIAAFTVCCLPKHYSAKNGAGAGKIYRIFF